MPNWLLKHVIYVFVHPAILPSIEKEKWNKWNNKNSSSSASRKKSNQFTNKFLPITFTEVFFSVSDIRTARTLLFLPLLPILQTLLDNSN